MDTEVDEQPMLGRRAFSVNAARSGNSVAALKPAAEPTLSQQIQALPEVQQDDLPMASIGDLKVAVGWDTQTWSR